MKNLDLVILAGGKGTRIKRFLKNKPKPMSKFNKIYLRELYFTLDELIYFKNINKNKVNRLKSKITNYFIKILLSLLTLNISNFIKYYARVYAYLKFIKKTK